jgi:hypothetical protein
MDRPSVPANTPVVFDVQLLYIPGEKLRNAAPGLAVVKQHVCALLTCTPPNQSWRPAALYTA